MTHNKPLPHEHSPYLGYYIGLVPSENLIEELTLNYQNNTLLLKTLTESQLNYQYSSGKWTIKEILQHLIDTERIFAYRCLRFARQDKTDLCGFEQDNYIAPAKAHLRTLNSLLHEYETVRHASISLINTFDTEMWQQTGTVNNKPVSVRALGYAIAGHEIHHINIIKQRYI